MRTVTIVGVGLIGGSFALALRKAGFTGKILGVSSARTIEAALARGVIAEGLPLAEAAARSDLIYLSQPISGILQTLTSLGEHVKGGCLVTDAGSTKATIVNAAAAALRRCQFLGGHPMAGKETRGVESADADLFVNRTYVVTPGKPSELETPAAQEFLYWVCRIGATPVTLDAQEHDRIVALTSHLPQLVSTALAATLAGKLDASSDLRVAGPGLSDATRLALSPFDIWADILKTNTESVGDALDAYIARLQEIRKTLDSPAMEREFETAAGFARRLRADS